MDIYSELSFNSVALGILILLIIYWFATRNHSYWARKGVPFIKPYPFIGSIPGVLTKSFEETEVKRYKSLGRIYGVYDGNKPALVIGKPELIKDILVKDFVYFTNRKVIDSGDEIVDKLLTIATGDDWKRIRTIVTPTFSTGKIKRIMHIFEDCTKTLTQNFKTAYSKGEPVDVLKNYGAFAMDVIASSAFSSKIDSHNDPNNDFAKNARAVFEPEINLKAICFFLMPSVMKKLGFQSTLSDNSEFFKKVTLQIIEDRRKTGQKRNDFVQLLLDVAAEVSKEEKLEENSEDIAANYGDNSAEHSVFKNVTSKHMSMNEIIAQCIIFFIAGYHTTATTLAMTTYLLALNEDVQEKVFEEVKNVLAETNGEFKYESIQKMKYLDSVLSESLRLYPPVTRLERLANADYKLRDTGITVKKGMAVRFPTYAMHHDAEFFPDPEKFDPERFSPENKSNILPYTYLPFGTGPRNCIGMRFALMEIKVCFVYIISAFRIKRSSKLKVPLEFENNKVVHGLIKPKDILLNLVPREDCPLKSTSKL